VRTREQVSFSPLPRRSAQTKIYAGQETAKPNKKGKAVKMNIKTRLRREPLPHNKVTTRPTALHDGPVV
jgi:hypothetical protein